MEPRPKRNSFYVSKGIPSYNVEITEDYITWHNGKNVFKLYSYNSTTKVAIDMNGRVYLPVDTSNNQVDETLLQHLDLRTLDELRLAAHYRNHEDRIENVKTKEYMMIVLNNKMIIRRGAFKLTFPCQVRDNDTYRLFLDRTIGAEKFDYIPVLLRENEDAPLIIDIIRNTEQIQNYIHHKRREHIRLNNSLELVVNATTNLLQSWKTMADQGYLTYTNFSTMYLAFRIGEQYDIIKGKWNHKVLHILHQENQIIMDNNEQNKPDSISSFICKDTMYLYTPSGMTTRPLKLIHKLRSFAKSNFRSIQDIVDQQNNDEYLMVTQAQNTAVHDYMVNNMFADMDKRLDMQFALIMDNRAITQSIQSSVAELGLEITGINQKIEKLTKRVNSLESFRDKLLSGKSIFQDHLVDWEGFYPVSEMEL